MPVDYKMKMNVVFSFVILEMRAKIPWQNCTSKQQSHNNIKIMMIIIITIIITNNHS